MATATALRMTIHSSLPDIKDCLNTNNVTVPLLSSLRKRTADNCSNKGDSLMETADSAGDDDDVVAGGVTCRVEPNVPPSPYFSPHLGGRSTAIVQAFIRNRKQFSPSWSEAAELVFSDSHPFKPKRRNRSEEKAETQDKEILPSRCSSESRCSSPKSQKKEHVLKRKVEDEKKKEGVEDGSEEKPQQHQKTHVGSRSKKKDNCKIHEVKPVNISMNVNTKESKGEQKNQEEHYRHVHRSKRVSLSHVKQRQSTYINSERLGLLKAKVDAAIREHKVYSMTGHYSSVRRALRQRGWVEKIDSDFKGRRRSHRFEESDENGPHIAGKTDIERDEGAHGQAEAEIINRMLRNITEDLCWLSKPYPYCWKDINKCDMVNRLPKAYFSNKVGLCNSLAHMQWYFEAGVCSTQFPRTYNISLRDDYDSFKDDFRLTACISTLKWLTTNYLVGGEPAVRSADGRVDVNIIEFALRRCAEYVKFREHEDIDMAELPTTWEHQWDHFLTQYYKLVNEGHILRETKGDPPTLVIVSNSQTMINLLRPYWPQIDIEGISNFWIVKPGGRCCGNGILIRSHLEEIMAIVNPSITRETRYVVQKYIGGWGCLSTNRVLVLIERERAETLRFRRLRRNSPKIKPAISYILVRHNIMSFLSLERPLLIYNTKFDIRQWFLVTNVYPLTIWMYKESYLRFCSSQFNLKSTHESIHLCNNAVQRRYKNGKRDRNLPDENMWDCYTFQTHLKALGYPTVWDEVIYPGMKESFVGALLASQDNMERRKNCFELYGADFMISDQITDGPWLIEINSNPAMDSSTSVTARMCPQVLEDIVKVVIDRRSDRNASTGAFELVFKQNCPPIPPYLGMSLSIRGKKVYKAPSESKHPRRPRYQLPDSGSDDESSESSEERNIVEKRCAGDFMQPIKTLREEIERLGTRTIKEGRLCVSEEIYSDSAPNDTDTSRGSISDRRMALEGKEISLKKKKIRKRRHRCIRKQENKYRYRTDIEKPDITLKIDDIPSTQKRVTRKTDWVRKNIDNIRGNNGRYSKSVFGNDREESRLVSRSQENLNIFKDYILSGQCFEDYKSNNQNSHEILEAIFREEMIKLQTEVEKTEFRTGLSPGVRRRNVSREKSPRGNGEESVLKPMQGPIIITGLWEPTASKNGEEKESTLANAQKLAERTEVSDNLLMVEGFTSNHRESSTEGLERTSSSNSLVYESDKNSISVGEITDVEPVDSAISSPRMNPHQNLDFETKFEKELRHLECTETRHKRKISDRDFTKALNITAPDLLVKDRGKCHKWQNSKTSMEYFREWKYKIDETRRSCEDMLTKLRYFKESNSKIKFKDVLHRRIEEEARLIQKMKQYKLSSRWKNMVDNQGDASGKPLMSESEEKTADDQKDPPTAKDHKSKSRYSTFKDMAPKIYAASLRLNEHKLRSYYAGQEEAALIISAESGAVRNVNEILPKIRLRNRPLLPNSGSGNCRALEAMRTRDKSIKAREKPSGIK